MEVVRFYYYVCGVGMGGIANIQQWNFLHHHIARGGRFSLHMHCEKLK